MISNVSQYAFTGRYTMFRNRIVSDVILCSPEEGNTNSVRIRALWDTGSSVSIVSQRVADFLRLPLGKERQFRSPFGATAMKRMSQAKICVVLGAALIPLEVGVDDHPNSDLDCDITLGLDFITRGDFAITHDGEQLILSFCYPPVGCPADFTLLLPAFSSGGVETESCIINESDAVESKRRGLVMLDYYREAAKAAKERDDKEHSI